MGLNQGNIPSADRKSRCLALDLSQPESRAAFWRIGLRLSVAFALLIFGAFAVFVGSGVLSWSYALRHGAVQSSLMMIQYLWVLWLVVRLMRKPELPSRRRIVGWLVAIWIVSHVLAWGDRILTSYLRETVGYSGWPDTQDFILFQWESFFFSLAVVLYWALLQGRRWFWGMVLVGLLARVPFWTSEHFGVLSGHWRSHVGELVLVLISWLGWAALLQNRVRIGSRVIWRAFPRSKAPRLISAWLITALCAALILLAHWGWVDYWHPRRAFLMEYCVFLVFQAPLIFAWAVARNPTPVRFQNIMMLFLCLSILGLLAMLAFGLDSRGRVEVEVFAWLGFSLVILATLIFDYRQAKRRLRVG